MLLWSDLGASRFERKVGRQVNARRMSFTGWSKNPTNTVQENGRLGTKAKPLAVGTTLAALLFVQAVSIED
jgi:hypothetical protein